MKKAISLFLVLAVLISGTVIAFSYPKKGEELLISKDNISYGISPSLYGISLDDMSFSCDGGLSSNLVNNNSFEYEAERFLSWDIDATSYSVQNKDGLNKNNKNYLSVTVDGEGTVLNRGYTEFYDYKTYNLNEKKKSTSDMGFKKGEKYEFSAYFKNISFVGDITVSLKAKGNSETYNFSLNGYDDWTKVISQIESEVTADGGLLITANGTGTFFMDFVSLVPVGSHGFHGEEWKYTTLRTDLYDALSALSPKFIRFPCGLVSGNSLNDLYNWKNTVGPLEERRQTYNPYNIDAEGFNYNNSNAMGYYEYFMLCEDLKAAPVPVVSAGIINQSENGYDKMREDYKNGALTEDEWQAYLDTISVRPGTEKWDSFVNDVLDLIEFANGSEKSKWGAVRAQSGHKEPFNMEYLAVGNEAYGDVYWRNFDALYKAIKAKYPKITVIASSGADSGSEDFKNSLNTVNEKYTGAMLDEHYYTENGYLFGQLQRYDSYERNGAKVIVGGWSAKSGSYGAVQTKNNIWSAVEGAAYLTGIERNGDAVSMISYSSSLAKVNAQNKDTNLVWFDSQGLCLTPDYYTQMLFANNCGTQYVSTDLNLSDSGVYESVTVDTEKEIIYVKLVNSQSKDVNLTLDFRGFGVVNTASNQYLSEIFKEACNEVGGMLHVAPHEKTYTLKDNKLNFELEGLSVNVIRIPYGDSDADDLYVLPEMGIVTPYIHSAFRVAIPCAITFLFVITGLAILTNRYSLKKREKNKPKDNG